MELFDFDGLILEGLRRGASDVHIETGFKPHFRIDGDVIESDFGASTHSHIEDIKSLVLNEDALFRLDKEHAVDRAYTVKENGTPACRLRISLAKCVEGFKVVCRIIPTEIPTFKDFDMPPVFGYIADRSTGMVIVAGVTGSGKSTTIAAMIESINRKRKAHVVTIEDPVEFMHEPKECIFTHREIGVNVSSFADGLRTSFRQDPDVILIGEMRDLESIRYGLMAAETGHLVFATVHSDTASDIPERIISVFPQSEQEQARYQIADVGLAYIAQKLVQASEGGRRHAAFEILVLNAAARNLIRGKKSHQLDTVMQTNVRFGCTTMTRSLIDLYQSGKIDKASLIRHSPNKERARKYVLEHVEIDIDELSDDP